MEEEEEEKEEEKEETTMHRAITRWLESRTHRSNKGQLRSADIVCTKRVREREK
jgi:hypothetical protein